MGDNTTSAANMPPQGSITKDVHRRGVKEKTLNTIILVAKYEGMLVYMRVTLKAISAMMIEKKVD